MKDEPEKFIVAQEPTTDNVATPRLPLVKRKNHFWLFALIGPLLVIGSGAGSIAVYRAFFEKQPTAQTNTAAQPAASMATAITANSVANEIKPLLKNPLITIKQQAYYGATGPDNRIAFTAPFYKPSGYEFETAPQKYSGLASQGEQSAAAADLAAIKTYLESKGFKHEDRDVAGYTGLLYAGTYFTDSIRCSVEETHYVTPYETSIGCADTSNYAESAKALQPLYVVYSAVQKPGAKFTFYLQEMKQSKTAGYATAKIGASDGGGGGYAVLFYQTPDSAWHYFTFTQEVVGCSRYNTADLRKAFLGETCANPDATESTVKL